MIFETSNPLSRKIDNKSTTTEIRLAATIVSPSNRSHPTRVSPFKSTEACGKWRNRLISNRSKSSFAVNISLASLFTMRAIFPRKSVGATSNTTNTTTTVMATIFTIFFILHT